MGCGKWDLRRWADKRRKYSPWIWRRREDLWTRLGKKKVGWTESCIGLHTLGVNSWWDAAAQHRSSAWCSVMTLEMCIHITDPLCYTAEPNKKLQSNYTPIKSNNDFKRTIWRFLKKKLRTITWSRYPIPVHMSIENHNSKRYRQSHSNQNSMVLAHKQKYRSTEQDGKYRGKPTHL